MDYRLMEFNLIELRKMRIGAFKMVYENLQKDLPDNLLQDALTFVTNDLGLPVIEPIRLKQILIFDGFAYAELIEFGINDTATKGCICNAISQEYLKRDWPKFGDKEDIDLFTTQLQEAIIKVK